jgi:uncharacterized protein YbjT (DUF2867 family)
MSVLITGATGKVGRRMVAALAAAGVTVRAGSRHPDTTASPHVTPVLFDWYDHSTWAAALGDADGLVVKGLDLDDYAHETVARLIDAAPHVRRVVMLSTPGVEWLPDEHSRRALELTVRNSGREWAILRASWFMQNFDEDDRVFADALRTRGELHAPAGRARVSFVDTRDVADALVTVLTTDRGIGHAHALTGPDSLTFGEVADAIGRATGRPVRHVDGPLADHREHLRGPDRSAAYVNHINHLFVVAGNGVQAAVSDDYQRLTGNAPRDFDTYVKEVWTP